MVDSILDRPSIAIAGCDDQSQQPASRRCDARLLGLSQKELVTHFLLSVDAFCVRGSSYCSVTSPIRSKWQSGLALKSWRESEDV